MASYIQGYDEERFVTTVNRNFLCLICFNVLKDPVLCPRNQHCFCRGCITKNLQNSQRCPTCADKLTEETLAEPQRMIKGYLNKLNIRQRTWSPLQSIPTKREGATSFVHNNQIVIAGGYCGGPVPVDDMVRMNVDQRPDLSIHWSECPMKLPAQLGYHSSVLYDDKITKRSRMIRSRKDHCTKIFDDNLLIVGGRKSDFCRDNLSSVVLYDIKNNVCKQVAPLPYEVSLMATARWGDNVVVIGGADKRGKALNTVIMYNVKTEQSHMLPPMRCKRRGCTAIVVENNIVVLGGWGERRDLKSVETFNFERNTWQELPEMFKARRWHTAVVV